MIRVLLVDDQNLVRSGISGLLGLTPDIRVLAEADSTAAAEAALASQAIDVLLLDNRMPLESGLQLLQRRGASLPPTLMLTTFDEDEAVLEAMRCGAKGFLLKDISLERLAEAIRRVARGETVFRPLLTERTRAAFETRAPAAFDTRSAAADRLTERETEVLALMAGGFSNGEIAQALGPSEGTIKNHVSAILAKLAVRDRVRAVLRGVELGYI